MQTFINFPAFLPIQIIPCFSTSVLSHIRHTFLIRRTFSFIITKLTSTPCPSPRGDFPVPHAARTAACLSGFASMTHSCHILFPATPHTLGNGAKNAPLPKQVKHSALIVRFPTDDTMHPSKFPPIPVPALSVRQAAFAAYPHTPPLCSGVLRYSTIRLTNLVRCDHLAAPNGSARKIIVFSVRLAILSHFTRLHSL